MVCLDHVDGALMIHIGVLINICLFEFHERIYPPSICTGIKRVALMLRIALKPRDHGIKVPHSKIPDG